jgi:hypothetical protein
MRASYRVPILYPLILCLLLCGLRPAVAEQISDVRSDASAEKAKEYEAKAERLMAGEHYAAALKAYRTAYALDPSPGYLYNIGVCYLRLGNPAEALAHFSDYLRREARPKQAILKDLETLLAQTYKLSTEGQKRKQEVLERLCYFGVVSVNCPANRLPPPAPRPTATDGAVASAQPIRQGPQSGEFPGSVAPPPPGPLGADHPDVPPAVPVYKRAWFWGVLAAGVVVVGAGVGAGVYAATQPHNAEIPKDYTPLSLTVGF